MLTAVLQVQQGFISDKAYEDLGSLFRRSWMHTRCSSPATKHATMSPNFRDGQRPGLPRLRSNSVPIAVSLMDCTEEEAGLIFSAAEKASARRRKAQSFDHIAMPPATSESPQVRVDSPLHEDAAGEQAEEQLPELEHDVDDTDQTPRRESVVTPLPSEVQDVMAMVSPGIKTYNDDMVKFVRQQLQDIAEKFYQPQSQPPKSEYTQYEEEPIWPVTPQRPSLRSHFSNWSTLSAAEEPVDIADLASSPPPTDDSIDDDMSDKAIEEGYAHVVHLRQRPDTERTVSPSYFSWPARQKPKEPPLHHRITFDTPITAELRLPGKAAPTTPLIDLDASQPDMNRPSRGTEMFEFGFRNSGQLTPSPSPSPAAAIGTLPLHMGQHLPSPQPIHC